jgi:hypothetical protein
MHCKSTERDGLSEGAVVKALNDRLVALEASKSITLSTDLDL